MEYRFKAVYEREGDWYIGHCPEVPGANGQGKSMKECRESLREAVRLIFENGREDDVRPDQ